MTYIKYEDPILKNYVKQAFDLLNMSDYARFDIRVDEAGRYYFIDPNCNLFLARLKKPTPLTASFWICTALVSKLLSNAYSSTPWASLFVIIYLKHS